MKAMLPLLDRVTPVYGVAITLIIAAAELINRLWVASVFWRSGTLKLQSWSSTLYLFQSEYAVPLLDPHTAAVIGTAVELGLPVLLALGLLGRFAAGGLVLFNITAVLSYPGLNAIGIQAHMIWSVMLLVVLFRGPGLVSVDGIVEWWRARTGPARDSSNGTTDDHRGSRQPRRPVGAAPPPRILR